MGEKIKEIQKKLGGIICHVSEEDIDLICKYASLVGDGEILVDLGTAYGKSCGAMAMINPKNLVYTLDIEESHLVLDPIPNNLITLRGDSRTYPWDKEIAMLNDDCGSHMYEETKENIEHWLPFVKRGGYIVFHDYLLGEFGVKRVVDEFVKKGKFKLLETKGISCAVEVL